MGGGSRYPFPKHVWSPAGGWWSNPRTWKKNTAIVSAGLVFIVYNVWRFSANREIRSREPTSWIPSMLWAKEFKSGQLGIREP